MYEDTRNRHNERVIPLGFDEIRQTGDNVEIVFKVDGPILSIDNEGGYNGTDANLEDLIKVMLQVPDLTKIIVNAIIEKNDKDVIESICNGYMEKNAEAEQQAAAEAKTKELTSSMLGNVDLASVLQGIDLGAILKDVKLDDK